MSIASVGASTGLARHGGKASGPCRLRGERQFPPAGTLISSWGLRSQVGKWRAEQQPAWTLSHAHGMKAGTLWKNAVRLSGLKNQALNPIHQRECGTAQPQLCFTGTARLSPSAIAQLSYKANSHRCPFLLVWVDRLTQQLWPSPKGMLISQGAHIATGCICLCLSNQRRWQSKQGSACVGMRWDKVKER